MSSSSNSTPCAACKSMRRRCTQECIFAPYFPSHDLQKFEDVHRIYGANRVSKILSGIDPNQRESAVKSLCFEAKERCRDPIYGCVGRISSLQERLRQVQRNIDTAKIELASYIGPSAFLQVSNDDTNNNAIGQERAGSHFQMMQRNNDPAVMIGVPLEPEHNNSNNDATSRHQQQILAQFVALREQEMSRSFGLLHVQENGGLGDGDNQTVSHHHRINNINNDQIREMQPSVHGIENRLHLNHHHHQLQQQIDSSGNYIHNQQLLLSSAHDEQQQIDNAGYVYGQQQLLSDLEQHQRPHSQMQQTPTSNVTEEFKRI